MTWMKRSHLEAGALDFSVCYTLRCHIELKNKTASAEYYYKECPVILRYL